MPQPHTKARFTLDTPTTETAVKHLLSRRCWFQVDPLPDDHWDVLVKPDAAKSLAEAIHVEGVPTTPYLGRVHIGVYKGVPEKDEDNSTPGIEVTF